MLVLPNILAHAASPGHGGGWGVALEWSFDPLTLAVVLLPAVLYGRGLLFWATRPRPLARWRIASFYLGLLFSFLALSSPIDTLSDDLFTMHMIQHLLIMMIVPPLIILGAPTTPLLLGLPSSFRKRVVRPLYRSSAVGRIYRFFTHPATVWSGFTTASWGWHLIGGAYDAAIEHESIHVLEHLSFYASGMLLWWVLIDVRPHLSPMAYPFRVLVMVGMMLQNIYLGATITLRNTLLYESYKTEPRLWGFSPLTDQQSGGALMWVGGDTLIVITLVVTGLIWFHTAAEKARREEARQDQLAAARAGFGAPRPTIVVRSSRPPRT